MRVPADVQQAWNRRPPLAPRGVDAYAFFLWGHVLSAVALLGGLVALLVLPGGLLEDVGTRVARRTLDATPLPAAGVLVVTGALMILRPAPGRGPRRVRLDRRGFLLWSGVAVVLALLSAASRGRRWPFLLLGGARRVAVGGAVALVVVAEAVMVFRPGG